MHHIVIDDSNRCLTFRCCNLKCFATVSAETLIVAGIALEIFTAIALKLGLMSQNQVIGCIGGGAGAIAIGLIAMCIIKIKRDRRPSQADLTSPDYKYQKVSTDDSDIIKTPSYFEITEPESLERRFQRQVILEDDKNVIFLNVLLEDQDIFDKIYKISIPQIKKWKIPQFAFSKELGINAYFKIVLPQNREDARQFIQQQVEAMSSGQFTLARKWSELSYFSLKDTSVSYSNYFPLPESNGFILKKPSTHNIFNNSLESALFPIEHFQPQDLSQLDGIHEDIHPIINPISFNDFEGQYPEESGIRNVFETYREHLFPNCEQKGSAIRSLFSLITGNCQTISDDSLLFLKAIYQTEEPLLHTPLPETFLKEELMVASSITVYLRKSRYIPDLMSILPIIYQKCLVPWKQRYDKAEVESKTQILNTPIDSIIEKKELIKAIVERSCDIKLDEGVVSLFLNNKLI